MNLHEENLLNHNKLLMKQQIYHGYYEVSAIQDFFFLSHHAQTIYFVTYAINSIIDNTV